MAEQTRVWTDPKDANLPVVEDGKMTIRSKSVFGYELGATTGRSYHHCSHCKGWIEGMPTQAIVADGIRHGWAFYCRRCGLELSFRQVSP